MSGYKYLSDRFESLSNKNESIWSDVEEVREFVYELDKEVAEKVARRNPPKEDVLPQEYELDV